MTNLGNSDILTCELLTYISENTQIHPAIPSHFTTLLQLFTWCEGIGVSNSVQLS